MNSDLSFMKENDARKCSMSELHERRKQIVRLHLKGHKVMEVAELAGVTHAMARRSIDLYEQGGMKALKPAARGTAQGRGRALSPEQEKRIRDAIRDRRPEQLKLDFALWNRNAVRELIRQEFSIELSLNSISDYLKRWGYTPQKPIRRAYEQNCRAVRKWLDEDYPAIADRCNAEQGEIHWCDETAVMNTDVHGRSYAPKGQTPVVPTPAARRKLSMISSVSSRGDARWMIVQGTVNADRLIEFMEALIKAAGKKVFIIMDNLPTHHCKPVRQWLKDNGERIEAHYLPSYSPELNPDERLNADLKNALRNRPPVRTEKALRNNVECHMRIIEAEPERVKAYFNDPYVRYAKS